MEPLVHFPSPGERWLDSGEGGLFVMLFVPEPENHQHNCYVEVSITASQPDAVVDNRPDLWPDRHGHGERFTTKSNAAAVLKEHGDQELHMWAWNTADAADQSVNMLAAVHLGSTHHCLQGLDGVWCATYADLSQSGKILHDTLKAAWGIDPILKTFIDT